MKLNAGPEASPVAPVCELLASLLAADLSLAVPQPYLVDIPHGFHEAASTPALAARFSGSEGLNFGSRLLTGYSTWPQRKAASGDLVDVAAETFAFDIIIQNPDRRVDKPNLLAKSHEIVLIDHEMAFSFLYLLGPAQQPWCGGGMDFVKDHVFYSS